MTDQRAPRQSPDPQHGLATIVDHQHAVQRSQAALPNVGSTQVSTAERSGIACAMIVLRLLEAALSSDGEGIRLFCDELASSDARDFSFEGVMQSASMQDAVWSNDYFRLFNQALCRNSAHDSWRPVPDRVRLITQDEHLRWDGVAGNNLTDHLSCYSTVKEDSRTGAQLARAVNAPMVLQVRFCNRNPGLTFYKDLFQFDLRVLGRAPDGVLVFRYRCIAAVRLRANPDDYDTLRLYHPDGELLRHSPGKFPWSDDWRVQDGGQYALFFVRIDSVSCDVRLLPADLLHPDAEDVRIARSAAKTPRESQATLPQGSTAATEGPQFRSFYRGYRGRGGHSVPQPKTRSAAGRNATPTEGPAAPPGEDQRRPRIQEQVQPRPRSPQNARPRPRVPQSVQPRSHRDLQRR